MITAREVRDKSVDPERIERGLQVLERLILESKESCAVTLRLPNILYSDTEVYAIRDSVRILGYGVGPLFLHGGGLNWYDRGFRVYW